MMRCFGLKHRAGIIASARLRPCWRWGLQRQHRSTWFPYKQKRRDPFAAFLCLVPGLSQVLAEQRVVQLAVAENPHHMVIVV